MNLTRSALALLLACELFCGLAATAPAPWYIWSSKLDGSRVCAQVSPGDGWERMGGPYRDAHCRKRQAT